MLTMYPACFFKERNGYSVIFPDLDFLSTCGDTLEESIKMATDCLAGYLYTMRQDEEVNSPSDLKDINLDLVAKELGLPTENAFVNIISVDVEEYAKTHFNKSVKKTLSIPQWLNDMAIEQHINFSKVLQDALKSELNIAN